MKKLNVALVGCWHPHVPRYYPILQKYNIKININRWKQMK